jgi:TonB family protein
MFTVSKSDLSRIAVSALGAVTVSATCILGAVAPAKAEAPQTVAAWQQQVEHRIARAAPDRMEPVAGREAAVQVHFSAGGDFAGAALSQTSGVPRLDRRAVRFAQTLRYPRLPAEVRGAPQDVTMRLRFGPAADGQQPARMVQLTRADPQLASR